MSSKTDSRLTPRERLTRGLTYSAVGPVDVTRGALGLGVNSVHSAASGLRQRYKRGKLAQEISAAQEVLAGLPQAIQDVREPRRHRRGPLVVAAAAAAVLAGGAVAFSIVRRSMQPEPSPRPPSVDVAPKP